jgi:hypothetical protein
MIGFGIKTSLQVILLNAKRQPLRRFHEIIMVFYKKQCTYNPQKTINPNGPQKRSLYAYNRENEGGETTGKMKKGVCVSSDYEADKLLPINIQVFKKPICDKTNLTPNTKTCFINGVPN